VLFCKSRLADIHRKATIENFVFGIDNTMKKIIAIMFLFVLVLPLPVLLVSTPDLDKKLHTICIYPTALVSDEFRSHGSSVIVRSEERNGKYVNVALTCQHVIQDGNPIKIYLTDYIDWSVTGKTTSYDAWVYAQNMKNDLAILIFYSDVKMPTAKIDFDANLHLGNDVFGVGCSQMENPRVDYGKITEIGSEYRTSVLALPGDSGGPVFYNYRLVGIKQSILTIPYNHFSMPVYTVSNVVPICKLKEWDATTGGKIGFVYDKSKPLPELAALMLNFYECEAPTQSPFGGVFPEFGDENHRGRELPRSSSAQYK
jgi:S1-C subfamily serine protease